MVYIKQIPDCNKQHVVEVTVVNAQAENQTDGDTDNTEDRIGENNTDIRVCTRKFDHPLFHCSQHLTFTRIDGREKLGSLSIGPAIWLILYF